MVEILRNSVEVNDLVEFIYKSLPEQGCIEVQHDSPYKEHSWHVHSNDETIVVLKGGLKFYSEDMETECFAGDKIMLPAGTKHGSIALDTGAVYVIAFEFLEG